MTSGQPSVRRALHVFPGPGKRCLQTARGLRSGTDFSKRSLETFLKIEYTKALGISNFLSGISPGGTLREETFSGWSTTRLMVEKGLEPEGGGEQTITRSHGGHQEPFSRATYGSIAFHCANSSICKWEGEMLSLGQDIVPFFWEVTACSHRKGWRRPRVRCGCRLWWGEGSAEGGQWKGLFSSGLFHWCSGDMGLI